MPNEERSYTLRSSSNSKASVKTQEKGKLSASKTSKAGASGIAKHSTARTENPAQRSPSGSPQHSSNSNTSGRSNSHVTAQTANAQASPEYHAMASGQSNLLPEMKEMFANLSKEMNSRFDNVSLDMRMMKVELGETRKVLQDLENAVTFNTSKIREIEKEIIPQILETIENKNKKIEEKLMLLELHDRKQNLLLYGVPEKKSENVYSAVYEVIAKFLQIPIPEAARTPLVNAHRLPSPKQGNPGRSTPPPPRPIIVRFAFMEDRNRLIESFEKPNRQRPANSAHPDQQTSQQPQPQQTPENCYDRVTIRTDLPPDMKRERGRLASIAYKIRKEKQLSTRIRVNGINLYLQTRKKAQNGSAQSPWINWDE